MLYNFIVQAFICLNFKRHQLKFVRYTLIILILLFLLDKSLCQTPPIGTPSMCRSHALNAHTTDEDNCWTISSHIKLKSHLNEQPTQTLILHVFLVNPFSSWPCIVIQCPQYYNSLKGWHNNFFLKPSLQCISFSIGHQNKACLVFIYCSRSKSLL